MLGRYLSQLLNSLDLIVDVRLGGSDDGWYCVTLDTSIMVARSKVQHTV